MVPRRQDLARITGDALLEGEEGLPVDLGPVADGFCDGVGGHEDEKVGEEK